MKVLFYIAELQSEEATKEKEEKLFLWAYVNEVKVVGVVSELNSEQNLGAQGWGAIEGVLANCDLDAIVIAEASDFSKLDGEVCAYVKDYREKGYEVISVAGDLPECSTCSAKKRKNHCTVKLFRE